jgi:hypothetical protein
MRQFVLNIYAQCAPDTFGVLQGFDDFRFWRRIIEEKHGFAARTLARVSARQLPSALAETAFASTAINLNSIVHSRRLDVEPS